MVSNKNEGVPIISVVFVPWSGLQLRLRLEIGLMLVPSEWKFIYLFMMKSYKSTQKNTKKNLKK